MTSDILYVKREQKDGGFRYPIVFHEDFSHLKEIMEEEGLTGRQVCIVTDTNVGPLYAEAVRAELQECCRKVDIFQFEAGEPNKNLNTVQALYEALIQNGMDRKGMLVALGGGVVGDLTGFAAATYLRGIDFMQIPTSLLAQVDSSVGGKTGVDFMKYKNMVGAFHQPRLVYMNVSTLKTLPAVQFACGMGEVIKTGLICDRSFYNIVRENSVSISALEVEALKNMIRHCCSIKAGVVERDPKEQGERALLNLGHTIGHAIEKLKDFSLLHGQCVALGLVAAAYLSMERGLLTKEEYENIRETNILYQLPVCVEKLTAEDIVLATKKDKKMQNGQIRFILMDGLGKSVIDHTVTDDELLKAVNAILV